MSFPYVLSLSCSYRDNAILWDPRVNTVVQLQRVALVIAHELSHQWFGNLVTAAWWSQLWLNEGFARFMQFVAGDAVSPALQLTDQFITVAQRLALARDSSVYTHAVSRDDETTNSLSDITYAKGASVLRMIVGLIGSEVFERGIRQYLSQYQYSSAYTVDLFTVLDATVKQAGGVTNVTDIMWEWTFVPGYPYLHCDSTPWVGNNTIVFCTQRRFYSYNESDPADTTWTIPLTVSYPIGDGVSESLQYLWPASLRTYQFSLFNFNSSATSYAPYIKFNTNTTGFYRVLYSDVMLAQLGQALLQPRYGGLYHDDRLGLINDLYTFYDKGWVNATQVLGFSLYLSKERSFAVWQVAMPTLLTLWNRVKYQSSNGTTAMTQYIQQIMTPVAQQDEFHCHLRQR